MSSPPDRWQNSRGSDGQATDAVDALRDVLDSSRQIAMATGILMGQNQMTSEQAFALLDRSSRRLRCTLCELSLAVIETGRLDSSRLQLVRPTTATGSHPATVRRAIAYVDLNLDRDVSTADIARACHLSVRALQLAFRRHLSTTPLAYLRQLRLDRARAELVQADPGDGATVADVAVRWGFASPSRFSSHYRATYGEYPRDTLRRHHPSSRTQSSAAGQP